MSDQLPRLRVVPDPPASWDRVGCILWGSILVFLASFWSVIVWFIYWAMRR